jgi:hypothetical protein
VLAYQQQSRLTFAGVAKAVIVDTVRSVGSFVSLCDHVAGAGLAGGRHPAKHGVGNPCWSTAAAAAAVLVRVQFTGACQCLACGKFFILDKEAVARVLRAKKHPLVQRTHNPKGPAQSVRHHRHGCKTAVCACVPLYADTVKVRVAFEIWLQLPYSAASQFLQASSGLNLCCCFTALNERAAASVHVMLAMRPTVCVAWASLTNKDVGGG